MTHTATSADGVLPPRATRARGVDAVTLLTVVSAVRLALPSQFVVGPLGGAGAPATIFGLLLAAYWLWHRLHRVRSETAAPVNAAAITYGAVALASYAVALSRPAAGHELSLALLSLLTLVSWLGGLLVASDGVTSLDRLRTLVSRLAVFGGVFAGFGLVQFVTASAWVDRISIPGLVLNTPIYPIASRDGFIRPFATAIHPIEFGSVIAMLLPLMVVLGLVGPRSGRRRWVTWLPAIAAVLAASLSSSRSTIVGVVIGLALLWPALTGLQRALGALIAGVLGVFVFVTVPGMVGTISGLFGGVVAGDSSVSSRIDSFAVAEQYFGRAPILGRGFGTFLPRYRIFDNQYLLALVETGILGTFALVMLWLVPVVGTARVLRRSGRGSVQRLIGTGLLASCVVGGVDLALFDGFGFPMMPAIWFILLGLSGAYVRLSRDTSS